MSGSDVVIRVEGLGKKYALHHEKPERYTALRDVLARQARSTGRLLNPFTLVGQLRAAQRHAARQQTESEEEFWALKDVSFEIHRGERVGIIGRNGAGKSTLLKILSRITEPSAGRVEIRGRVASLLEVGTGFHPELSGRENIYLNGAILGMTRREIRTKFDEIVDFAEVERFLDTPVKRYSSGMYVRLAFAVAAHLEPEILVVDEVLAVGDASFQMKCLGKMEDVADREGRTVLFVSHQMAAIQKLCQSSILLVGGKLEVQGPSSEVVDRYLSGTCYDQISLASIARPPSRGERFRFASYEVGYDQKNDLYVDVRAEITSLSRMPCLISVGFCSLSGELLFNCPFYYEFSDSSVKGCRPVLLRLRFFSIPLSEGVYRLNFFCSQSGDILDYIVSAGSISIPSAEKPGTETSLASLKRVGVLIDYEWIQPDLAHNGHNA